MSIEWIEVARRGKNHAVLLIDQVCESYARGLLGPTLDSDFSVQHYRQVDGARWMSLRDVEGYVLAMKAGEEQSTGMLLEKARERDKIVEEMQNFANSLVGREVSFDSSEKHTSEFMDICIRLWATAYHYIMLNKFYPELLTSVVAQRAPDVKKQNECLTTLFSLPDATQARLEKNSVLDIALASPDKQHALIVEHLKEFSHLGRHYYWGDSYSAADIEKRVEALRSIDLQAEKKAALEQEKIEEKTSAIFEKLKFTNEEKLIVETSRAWGRTANYADEVYSLAVDRLAPWIKEACKEWHISWNQFASMRVSEIENAFANGVDDTFASVLASRAKDHAIILNNPNVEVLHGSALSEYKRKEIAHEESMHHLRELQGQSVYPGKVKGKVCIISEVGEVAKLKPGEVLVADSTFPAFVPAMERASAIVTNEGGLLCHAAIVSRELSKPCIVGTRLATKVFRDGEEVEVDATNGTIKKIK